jgi:hypothetical protein
MIELNRLLINLYTRNRLEILEINTVFFDR